MKHNRDGTPNEQSKRYGVLMEAAKVLQNRFGYSKHWKIENFGSKEVHRLVSTYKKAELSPNTIANKLVHLRWLGEKIGAIDISSKNADYNVYKDREHTPKAVEWSPDKTAHLDERMQLVFESKALFGLREVEALKLRPNIDVKQDRLELIFTKGGRPRSVPIETREQRDLARRLQAFHARHPTDRSMIPANLKYNTYRHRVQTAAREMGIKGHGYRHAWAQQRFEKLSGGIKSPLSGGPQYKTLTLADQAKWNYAASAINQELGHGEGRATYIGGRS